MDKEMMAIFALAGFVLGGIVVVNTPTFDKGRHAEDLIEQRQADLPRSQKCVLAALPEASHERD